ncbi:MAG: succinyl-CoA--3-ketoacid-CoA transferase [Halobacteriovoraceae bacterium]|nr:succinyl-CoA--3-ketoacid-CoA transferase [Halobacteriovoraceae bacterium]|tara:strand:+ start:1099 stop:1791 length:693 start_codon:yes stop_codon:yes gene_type:complete
MYSKKLENPKSFLNKLNSGISIMSGGFGLCGIPENSIEFIGESKLSNLTVISNNIGNSGRGLVNWLKKKKISKAICSYVGGNPDLEELILKGEIEIDIIPQGTFIEKIRSKGAGIPAFYTPTGVGTLIEKGKETKSFNNRKYLLEESLGADLAIIKASKGDYFGNLYFEQTSQNFSPLMAMAADLTIVEVEELVPIGDLEPHEIHLPGIFVDYIYQGKNYKNDIEKLLES